MAIPAGTSAPARTRGGATLAIEAHGLVKTYPKGVRALDGLTFGVDPGTVFALLGPNGAGKSTTVKILTTLAQADAGTASVAGLDVRAQAAQVRHAIGVVAQRSGADPMATGRENLLLSGRIKGLRGTGLVRRADDLLSRFNLAGAAGRLLRTYSGGMQRPRLGPGPPPGRRAGAARRRGHRPVGAHLPRLPEVSLTGRWGPPAPAVPSLARWGCQARAVNGAAR